MNRPAHIAPLDEALKKHMAELVEAEQRQIDVVAEHAEFLALHAEELAKVEQAVKDRMNAYYAARDCEKAIKKLGYCVAGAPGESSNLDGHPGNFRVPLTRPAVPTDTETTP